MEIKEIVLPIEVLNLFVYSFKPCNYNYNELTNTEKSIISKDKFDKIVSLINALNL